MCSVGLIFLPAKYRQIFDIMVIRQLWHKHILVHSPESEHTLKEFLVCFSGWNGNARKCHKATSCCFSLSFSENSKKNFAGYEESKEAYSMHKVFSKMGYTEISLRSNWNALLLFNNNFPLTLCLWCYCMCPITVWTSTYYICIYGYTDICVLVYSALFVVYPLILGILCTLLLWISNVVQNKYAHTIYILISISCMQKRHLKEMRGKRFCCVCVCY